MMKQADTVVLVVALVALWGWWRSRPMDAPLIVDGVIVPGDTRVDPGFNYLQ
jgi:hypothetical protein